MLLVEVVTLLGVLLLPLELAEGKAATQVEVQNCTLDGLWYDPASSPSTQLLFRFSNLPDYGEIVVAETHNGQWTTGKVSFNFTSGLLTVFLDDGGKQVGTLDVTTCNQINWSVPAGPVWVRVPLVSSVHVVFMNHLDVGYNGIPETGFINNVLNKYFQEYFPRAIRLAADLQSVSPSTGFIYTTHPWLISMYLDCPPNMVLNGIRLQCPTVSEVKDFENAIRKGYITWHAGPMNMQVELMNEALFNASLQISKDLDERFSHKTTVLSQRDVPGLTAAAIPLLVAKDVEAVTVGVNSGSAPPAVPDLFLWEYHGHSVVAMWHPGGYPSNPGHSLSSPGGLSIKDCVIAEASGTVLAFAFRTDNSGPPESVDEILTYYEILKGEFPGANVSASTFENFVQSIDRSSIPLVVGEIGDTWIQGVASDPRKMAELRAASSGLLWCIQENKCDLSESQVKNASRFLIKLAEHTWGLPDVHDNVNWTNTAFQKAKDGINYINCENSWIEQRLFMNLTLEASYGHPLHDYISKALADLYPSVPSLDGYKQVDPTDSFHLFEGMCTIGFDSRRGWINTLVYQDNKTYTFASKSNPLALLSYHTYNESDFQFMNSLYDYYGNAGYDKPNSTLNAHPNSSVYYTTLVSLYQSRTNPAAFILKLQYEPFANSYYGAPAVVWIQLFVYSKKESQPKSDLIQLNLELTWVNKTATRLAEATMFSFYPRRQYSNSEWYGYVQKISNDSWIPLNSVVKNGSQYQHVAQKAALSEVSQSTTTFEVVLHSPDIPLVCPIVSTVKSPTPFPAPLTPIDTSQLEGLAFNLHNNVWNTNYPLWYPFTKSDGNFKARFKISFIKNSL